MSTTAPNQIPTTTNRSMSPCPVCEQLRRERREDALYVVAPATAGGWAQWSLAVGRLVRRLADQSTHRVVFEQPGRTQRALRLTIGHGEVLLEATGNAVLEGASRLSGIEERLLVLVGWSPGAAGNWVLHPTPRNWDDLVETITATLVGIFRFSEQLPVRVDTAQIARPCASCTWGAEPTAA